LKYKIRLLVITFKEPSILEYDAQPWKTKFIGELQAWQNPGDAQEWPTFITTYRRTTADCGFFESENMEQLRKCLNEPARNCVRMVLLTNNAERVISMLEKNFGGTNQIIDQLLQEARL
jgi:hypothetical protein